MRVLTVEPSPVKLPEPTELFGPYDACDAPQTQAVVLLCGDPRYRKTQKDFLRTALHLGTVEEEYVMLPIPGGAALFAYPQELEAYYQVLSDCLNTYCVHFDTVCRFVLLGHSGCKHMHKVYQRLGIEIQTGEDRIRQDLVTVAQAFEARSETSDCPVARLFAMFKVAVEVYYLHPSRRIQGKFDIERIRV